MFRRKSAEPVIWRLDSCHLALVLRITWNVTRIANILLMPLASVLSPTDSQSDQSYLGYDPMATTSSVDAGSYLMTDRLTKFKLSKLLSYLQLQVGLCQSTSSDFRLQVYTTFNLGPMY